MKTTKDSIINLIKTYHPSEVILLEGDLENILNLDCVKSPKVLDFEWEDVENEKNN